MNDAHYQGVNDTHYLIVKEQVTEFIRSRPIAPFQDIPSLNVGYIIPHRTRLSIYIFIADEIISPKVDGGSWVQ